MSNPKPVFVVAGPGAGKTHSIVSHLVDAIGDLSPHRYLAVITYTQAATRLIRSRVSAKTAIPRNVFIGTNHAFVARFVLKPYGTILEELPAQRVYSAVQINAPAPTRNSILKNLRKKGVVDYNSMVSIGARLLKDQRVRDRVGRRLQYLYVDEFQDVTPGQLAIFEELRKAKHTKVRVVGDPEQYISSFTFKESGMKRPDADRLPFVRFQKASATETIEVNRRSNEEIVAFANQFRDDLKQTPEKPNRQHQAVVFLEETCLVEMVNRFRAEAKRVERVEELLCEERLYLAKANNCFDDVRAEFGIVHIGKDGQRNRSLHSDARELLSQAMSMTERAAIEHLGGDLLLWRKIACRLLGRCKERGFSFDDFKTFVKEECREKTTSSRENIIADGLAELTAALLAPTGKDRSDISSSINRAKGLEADAVLVVAKNNNELRKLLEADLAARKADKSDSCRLGYVAATRARELLCFGCLEALDKKTREHLERCNVYLMQSSRAERDG